jgi:hypothetical protein
MGQSFGCGVTADGQRFAAARQNSQADYHADAEHICGLLYPIYASDPARIA